MCKQHSTVVWPRIYCGFDRTLYTPTCVTSRLTFEYFVKQLSGFPEVEI